MNAYMHQTAICDAVAQKSEAGVIGRAEFTELGGRTGTLSMFFNSPDDCQEAADRLAQLAKEMREHLAEVPGS